MFTFHFLSIFICKYTEIRINKHPFYSHTLTVLLDMSIDYTLIIFIKTPVVIINGNAILYKNYVVTI